MTAACTARRPLAPRGFSLIEILIVVTILGILAAIAVPKFANASQIARENSLKDDLRLLRTQIGVYRTQHNDLGPGFPGGDPNQTPTAQAAADQLMKCSDSAGVTADSPSATFKWGPYVTALPENPVNGKATWKILGPDDPFTPDDSTGWLYQPYRGLIKANVSAVDSAGKPIIDY
jgi:general secretion pathway protein G